MSMGALFTGRTPSLGSGDPAGTIALNGPNSRGGPGQTKDVSADHPEIAEERRARIEELTQRLAAPQAAARELSPIEVEVVKALGYLGAEAGPGDTPQPPPPTR